MYRTFLAAVVALVFGGTAPAQVTNTVVAATGQSAPGGGTYTGFNALGPSMNATGQVAFYATTTGSGSGVFRYTGTTGTAIARNGGTAPGGAGTYAGFGLSGRPGPGLNASGQVAFESNLSGASDSGIILHNGVSGSVVVLNQTAAPGGGTLSGLSEDGSTRLRLNASGQVALGADVDDEGVSNVFRYTGGTGVAIARNGAPSPGGNGNYGDPSYFTMSDAGQVAFYASLGDGSVSPVEGIFRGTGATTTVIALDGQTAPGGTDTFNGFQNSPVSINAGGQVAFNSQLTGGQAGIFRGDGATTVAVARSFQTAPGTGGGVYGTLFTGSPTMNDSGQVAFFATLSGGTGTRGVFVGNGTTTTLVAIQGATAPGTTATFAELSLDSVRINNAGQVAFRGILTVGGSVTTSNDSGLWYGTSPADLTLIAREGDVFVIDGVGRTLGQVPAAFEFTEAGLAWRAVFTDNSTAIIVSSIAPVPEPAAVLALSAAALLAAAFVRRRVVSKADGR